MHSFYRVAGSYLENVLALVPYFYIAVRGFLSLVVGRGPDLGVLLDAVVGVDLLHVVGVQLDEGSVYILLCVVYLNRLVLAQTHLVQLGVFQLAHNLRGGPVDLVAVALVCI